MVNYKAKVSRKWLSKFPQFCKNKILLVLLTEMSCGHSKNEVIYWSDKRSLELFRTPKRRKSALEIIKACELGFIKKESHIDKENLDYFEIKRETLEWMMKGNFNKDQLLFLLWILDLYTIKDNKRRNELVFPFYYIVDWVYPNRKKDKHKSKTYYRNLIEDILVRAKGFMNSEGETLIRDFSIDGSDLIIKLTLKSTKRQIYKENGKSIW